MKTFPQLAVALGQAKWTRTFAEPSDDHASEVVTLSSRPFGQAREVALRSSSRRLLRFFGSLEVLGLQLCKMIFVDMGKVLAGVRGVRGLGKPDATFVDGTA